MKRIITLMVLLLTVVSLSAAPKPKSLPHQNQTVDGYRGIWFTLGQMKKYGDKYSGGLGSYTMKHIPMAAYAEEVNKTFFVYGGTPQDGERYLQCMVGCYDHNTGMLQKPRLVFDKGQNGVNDPHDNPTIQIDKDGYIWVFVAGRGNKRNGVRFRSNKPYDITSFKYINEDIMAYPQIHYSPEKGFFLFFTRYDGKRQLFFRTSKDGKKWSAHQQIASIKEEGDKQSGHYQITNCRGQKVVSAFNRHPNGNCDGRTNIYFIQSEDWGQTWTTVDGTPIELPLTTLYNDALVRDYQSQGRNCYIKDVNFDKDGNPVILYLTSDNHLPGPEGGIRKWHTLHWDGKEWIESQFTTSTHSYDSGSIWTEDDKEWTVIIPSDEGPQPLGSGGGIVRWVSRNEGKTWKRAGTITSGTERNHGYVRRPQNANEGFYAYWSDGNPDTLSPSRLYFYTKDGQVFQMPYDMSEEWCKPIPFCTEKKK